MHTPSLIARDPRPTRPTRTSHVMLLAHFSLLGALCLPESAYAACANTVHADVVALNQPFFYNRLGAVNPSGMIFALRNDVDEANRRLKDHKRARPIVLRVNAADCLSITLTNLLNPVANSSGNEGGPENHAAEIPDPADDGADEPATRKVGIHVMGMPLANSIADDGSHVGKNPSSLIGIGGSSTYTYRADREGAYLLYSSGANTGGEGNGGSLSAGLFGVVNVEPPGAEYYRSQVTADDLRLATLGHTADGHPLIDYDAVYPAEHPRAGLPILKMTQGSQLVHSDLNAIITGPGRGNFPLRVIDGYTYYKSTPQNPHREQPFREFSVVFHDELIARQAFPEFSDPILNYPLHPVGDKFAINYGTAGIGSEILANRKGLGPMGKCTECKYEEFFLTSWAVGDPAMNVDVPANASDPANGIVATKAYYPDDPSNVHHSYINDHVKFRNVHAGPKEHHIFHLHSHQWVQTPDSPDSTYLDSQAIGPGVGFTYEIAYNGSGNRNKTVGDAIFHCHFYPHFAQGMWALWRNHDVFEDGSRKLPDGEIAQGTPIPALVPIPTLAMAPMPGAQVTVVDGQAHVSGTGNPGYPFFMATGPDGKGAAIAGHRPPTPPLDLAEDGGLPRHIVIGCAPWTEGTPLCYTHEETELSFDKTLHAVSALEIPEDGTALEKTAMAYHTQIRNHPSFTPEGAEASFVTNGSGAAEGKSHPMPGAPFADPCVDDHGSPTGTERTYKVAAIQLDITLNKAGWHFPQSRMLSLWNDVAAFKDGSKPPEPLFFRANTGDCITFHHTNLVPNVYEQDDFQVRTPTDVIGQHIHLVKFDVTSSDGSGNGFNYEDGTLSMDEVAERIGAINHGTWNGEPGDLTCKPGGPLGTPCARTTIQRWYADDTMGMTGDKTLRTVFTHDHYGPSTHQQVGLYASLVIEPRGSAWAHNETGQVLGTRPDGGPTSWQAMITNVPQPHREFLLQFGDFQLAYRTDGTPVNPPARDEVPATANPPSLQTIAPTCPNGLARPCPEAISADDVGTMSVNYRNEPLALRVQDGTTGRQATGLAGDLSFAYASIARPNSALNGSGPYPPLTAGAIPDDPYTPLMRAYENDKVQVRVQVGATEEGHNMDIHGLRWMHQPDDHNSGYRNSQMLGISEHFEMDIPSLASVNGPSDDYLYQVSAAAGGQWNGVWGLLRAYHGNKGLQKDLAPLPNNPRGHAPPPDGKQFKGICPRSAPVREFHITALTAQQALPGGTLVYNKRTNQGGMLHDPTALLYLRTTDLDSSGTTLKSGVPVEPLILRANAGDCINVTLANKLPETLPDQPGHYTLPMLTAATPGAADFNANQAATSRHVGLHPQLLAYDMADSDGANVGANAGPNGNKPQTAGPGQSIRYTWYAGEIAVDANGSRTATSMEYGAVNLIPSDPIKQPSKGAIGALVIEPEGACPPAIDGKGKSIVNAPCGEDSTTRAAARFPTAGSGPMTKPFREFVLVLQNSVNLRRGTGALTDPAVPLTAQAEDPEDSGHKAFNYRSEPLWKRMGFEPDTPLTGPAGTLTRDFSDVLSNDKVGGDPETPVLTAKAKEPVYVRIVHPGGVGRNNVFNLHGHGWQEDPFVEGSRKLGFNTNSEYKGSEYGIGPTSHINCLMDHAGGPSGIKGDYLYRDQSSFAFDGGMWGILRVE